MTALILEALLQDLTDSQTGRVPVASDSPPKHEL